jgi:hypothetical protein
MKAPIVKQNYEQLEAGNYMARLYQIIYIGTVLVEWKGVDKMQSKIRLSFEFPTEKRVFNEENGEQPYVLSREFTFSMNKKGNFRPMIESWLGKKLSDEEAIDFDIDTMIGKEAMVNVVHNQANNGNTYANISTVSPLMKGSKCPQPINKQVIFGINNWNQEFFDDLPDFIKEKIMTSDEYKEKFKNGLEEPDEEEVTENKEITNKTIKDLKKNKDEEKEEIDLDSIPF